MLKKFFIFFILLISAIVCSAQWKGKFNTDSYTEEKYPIVVYINESALWKIYYTDEALCFVFLHTEAENFDLWWNSQMDNNGWIAYNSDIDLNFIGKVPKEINLNGEISNYEKDNLYFKFVVEDTDGEILRLLKSNTKLNIRFYNVVKEQTMVYKVPLTGFSAQCKKVGM